MRKAQKILVSRMKVVRPIGLVLEIVQARLVYVSRRPRVLDHHHLDDSALHFFGTT
jgi:hypothetical protein